MWIIDHFGINKKYEKFVMEVLTNQILGGTIGDTFEGHKGRKGQRGGSLPKGASSYSGKIIKGARAIRDAAYKKIMDTVGGNCTCTLDGEQVNFKSGYQVAFQTVTSEKKDSKLYLTDSEYDKLVNDLRNETGSEPFVGVFGSPEISFRCRSMKQAMQIAKRYNQLSVWDWGAEDEKENKEIDKETNNIGKGGKENG